MKTKYYTIRNIREALEEFHLEDSCSDKTSIFLDALKATKPGERENIIIATIEPE